MAQLALQQLTKRFPNGVEALRSISLAVDAGELLTVVGPSGCGKSTLLRLIAGLEAENEGEILLEGKSLKGLPPKKRDMAILFQNYALFPHLNLLENMSFGLKIRGMKKKEAEAQATSMAESLGISDLLLRLPGEISGGQRQRAALGRAILRKPKLFLLDEPLSSLDAALRAQLRVEIARWHRELKATMLFVTHDQVEALTLGNRVAVLAEGQLQQVADPDTLYYWPANQFVASFIGQPGMNLFPGQLHFEANEWSLSPLGEGSILQGKILLPPELIQKHKTVKPGPVTVGLRPEHAHPILETPPGNGGWLQGEISVVEKLGGSSVVYLQRANQNFAIKTHEPFSHPVGATVHFWPQDQHFRFFSIQTGLALT